MQFSLEFATNGENSIASVNRDFREKQTGKYWQMMGIPNQHLQQRLFAGSAFSVAIFAAVLVQLVFVQHGQAQQKRAKSGYPPQLPGSRTEVYKTVGDTKLQLWIYESRKTERQSDSAQLKGRPAIVFFFGGGWKAGSPAQFAPHCQHLAKRGFVAITADYRVSSRHGVKPMQCVADAKSAIRYVRRHAERLGIDKDRIIAAGGSAGGHLAACTATVVGFDETSEDESISSVPNAMALFNPAVMLAPFKGNDYWDDERRERITTVTDGNPEAISPIHHIQKGTPPTIIFHGTGDTTVSIKSVRDFAAEMKRRGNTCILKEYEGQPHGFFNYGRGKKNDTGPSMYELTIRDLDQFIDDHIANEDEQDFDRQSGKAPAVSVKEKNGGTTHRSRQIFDVTKKGHVAFLGGSITEMNGYRPKVMAHLRKQFPNTEFTETNAGISSTCSTTGAYRLKRDVLSKGPVDLLFVEFAVNDDQDAGHAYREAVRGMEGVIRQVRRHNPEADVVMVHFVNPSMLETVQKGGVPTSIAAHSAVARHYKVPYVSVAHGLAEKIEDGSMTWKQFGGTHPKGPGNQLAADLAFSMYQEAGQQVTDSAPFPHEMPAPQDAGSYIHGQFVDIKTAMPGDGWTLGVPDWKSLPGSKRSRYTNIPILSSDTSGAECTLRFDGSAVGAFVVAGPDAGMLEAKIDDGEFKKVDLYHHYSKGLHYPRTVMFATDLEPANHTLTIRISESNNKASVGHAARIMQFAVNGLEPSSQAD